MTASVKIMLSYDYCHFEIALSNEATTMYEANSLRKNAQRLADEAVRQYKVAKEFVEKKHLAKCELPSLQSEVTEIKKYLPCDWSSRQKGIIKALEDAEFAANHKYDYDDDENFQNELF